MTNFNDVTGDLSTQVIFASEARKQLFKGLLIAAEAVGCTLGPRGKTVLIQRESMSPMVTKDGVTVAKAIKLSNPIAQMGAQLVLEAAAQTNDIAGDGTTTATILTLAMVREGIKLLEAGYPSVELCRGINRAVTDVARALKDSAVQLKTSEEIAQVGTISANGDAKIGELIAQAMDTVGRDGIITVEDAKGMSTSLDVVEGARFDRGYLSPYFVTNGDRMQAVYNDALVLVTDKKLSSLRELIPVLEKVSQAQRPLLIIADDVEGEALQGLVINRVKGNLPCVAIKAPKHGAQRDDLLRDICVMTNAKLVSSSTGLALDKLTLGDLGQCKKLVVDAKTSTMIGLTSKDSPAMAAHLLNLKTQLEDVTLDAVGINWLRSRIARMAAGVAVIRVGGATEVEMTERHHRVEDALNATRCAAEEGIVPGGGMAFFNIVDSDLVFPSLSDAEKAGCDIVLKACLEPLRRIVKNAGKSDDVVINELQRHQRSICPIPDRTVGYNAATGDYTNMVRAGIVDPVKVTLTALKNACSVAVTFLSLDAVIVDEKSAT